MRYLSRKAVVMGLAALGIAVLGVSLLISQPAKSQDKSGSGNGPTISRLGF